LRSFSFPKPCGGVFRLPVSSSIGLSLRSSPIGARVRNKWGAKRSLSPRFEQTRSAAAHPRPVGHQTITYLMGKMKQIVLKPKHISELFSRKGSIDVYCQLFSRLNQLLKDTLQVDYNYFPANPNRLEEVNRISEKHGLMSLYDPCFVTQVLISVAPELVFPIGFDEMRFSDEKISDPSLSADAEGVWDEIDDSEIMKIRNETIALFEDIIQEYGANHSNQIKQELENVLSFDVLRQMFDVFSSRVQYRSPDGVWHTPLYVLDQLVPKASPLKEQEYVSGMCQNWVDAIKDSSDTTTSQMVFLPSLWHPGSETLSSILRKSAQKILYQLYQEGKSLQDLHWRTLEEIVAELLTDIGLKVTVTKRSWDGGRDVIARGELIPGEPTVFAVEVKHMPVVPISKLREALWANRNFPGLLFATSGRFSAGVFKEKNKEETQLRLYLKDGLGLGQWIDLYAQRRGSLIITDNAFRI